MSKVTHITLQLLRPLSPTSFYLCFPFFSSPLANLSPFPFSSHPPLLSSFSHAPVGEHNEMVMAGL